MPVIPLRRKLLDELDDIDCSFKRARLEKYLQDIREDLYLLDDDISMGSCSSCSSISSLSTVSDNSSLMSDGNNSSDNLSTHSLSLTDLEDMVSHSLQAELDALRSDIEST